VSVEFDGECFYVSGRMMTDTRKYKNVLRGNAKVALVFDDHDPETHHPRGIKIHGTAEIVERAGHAGVRPYLRVQPLRSWSWGIESHTFVDGRPLFRRGVQRTPD
ncbi:MAG: pyridoxamine 5'-phosphate oxidase family protein, partial [Chloroflexi bacterium]|nr:pyridoxamine 5'-phosphate oxidase family protein [Chloroflexota bacterium]